MLTIAHEYTGATQNYQLSFDFQVLFILTGKFDTELALEPPQHATATRLTVPGSQPGGKASGSGAVSDGFLPLVPHSVFQLTNFLLLLKTMIIMDTNALYSSIIVIS